MYGLMLLVAVILSCITLAPGLQSFLQKVSLFMWYFNNPLSIPYITYNPANFKSIPGKKFAFY